MSSETENPTESKPSARKKVVVVIFALLVFAWLGTFLCHPSIRAEGMEERGEFDQALALYDEATRNPLYNLDPAIYLEKAYCYRQLGQIENSEAEVKKAEAAQAKFPFYWSTANLISNRSVEFKIAYEKALNHLYRQDYKKALKCYDKALAETRDSFAFSGRGKVHEQLGDMKAAESDFKSAMSASQSRYRKETESAYHEMGSFYARHDRAEESLPFFDKAVRARACPSAYRERGLVQWKLGKLEEALADFNKSLSLKESPSAYSNRAMFNREQKDFGAAIRDIDKAIAIAPDSQKQKYEGMKKYIEKEMNDPQLRTDSGF